MEENKIAFAALIKEHKQYSLVSGEKQGRVVLQYMADDDEIIDGISHLHKADKFIMIVFMEKENDNPKS